MTESTRELFNNFKGTLNAYLANAFGIGIGMYMTAPKILNDKTKEEYKNFIRKNIKEEIELEKSLKEYATALVDEYNVFSEILNAIESLRKNSYDEGRACYRSDAKEEYERLQSVFSEDYDAFINYMEKELENA
jgi:hypothetical protein